MRLTTLIFGIVLWLGGLSVAETPVKVHFETIPPGCRILVEGLEQPVAGSKGKVEFTPSLLPEEGEINFRLMQAGYRDVEVHIPAARLRRGETRWPEDHSRFLRFHSVLVRAEFHTSPEGANIWLQRGGAREFLGLTGQTLQLNLAELSGDTENGFFEVTLELPGYENATVPISNHLLGSGKANRWPQKGFYSLQSLNPISSFLRHHLLTFGSAVLFSGLLIVGWWLPKRRHHQRIVAKAQRIVESLSTPDQFENLSGRKIGSYRLMEPIGAGGMSGVYRALPDDDAMSESEARAIKVIRPERSILKRFRHEVSSLLSLNHPSIVRLDDWGEAQELLYIVMELVDGQSLRQLMRPQPGPRPELLPFLLEAMDGLVAAHEIGIVHADIKPENILVTDQGKVKVVDFGLAQHQGKFDSIVDDFCGTAGYVAPEQFSGKAALRSSDQYAFGVVAFELLTRRLPFDIEPGTFITKKQMTEEPLPPNYYNPAVTPELNDVLVKMLAREPSKRFGSLAEARWALGEALKPTPTS